MKQAGSRGSAVLLNPERHLVNQEPCLITVRVCARPLRPAVQMTVREGLANAG